MRNRFMVPMHGRKAEEALHEPQSAAGILPADPSEQSTAGKMPAAPWRCRLIRFRFMVPMPAQKRKGAFHEPDPLIPSFSPHGGEGARRAVQGDSVGFI